MMAAALNGALAQQKGLGIAHAIGNALDAVSPRQIDSGAVGRLVLPGVLRFYAEAPRDQYKPLRDVLALSSRVSLADGFETFLRDLPLPGSLNEIGIGREQICAAAALAARDRSAASSPKIPRAEDIASIMYAVR
jgi:alcohol dehydrogenase class IV